MLSFSLAVIINGMEVVKGLSGWVQFFLTHPCVVHGHRDLSVLLDYALEMFSSLLVLNESVSEPLPPPHSG